MDESRKLHPVLWVAAVSVTILSAVGIAAITGVLPHSGGQNVEPAKVAAVATIPPVQPLPLAAPAAAPTAMPVAPAPAAAPPQLAPVTAMPEPTPAPAKVHKHKKPVHVAQANSGYAPPPVDAVAPPPGTPYPPPTSSAPMHKACPECATVESVRALQQQGQGSGLGAIAGGLVGGLLGNQVGAGHGRDAATVVGALAGGFAGNEVEKSKRSSSRYEVVVRFEDGTSQVFKQDSAPPWQAGDRVKVVNGAVVPR